MIFKRFPRVAQAILKTLDDQSLMRSKEASKEIAKFFENSRFIWIRFIKKYKRHFGRFKKTWKNVIANAPVKIVKELAIAVDTFFQIYFFSNVAPIQIAVLFGSLQLCEYIIEKSDEKNPANYIGWTPLHYAAERGFVDICKLIMDNVDDIYPRSRLSKTPKDLAARQNQKEVLQLFESY